MDAVSLTVFLYGKVAMQRFRQNMMRVRWDLAVLGFRVWTASNGSVITNNNRDVVAIKFDSPKSGWRWWVGGRLAIKMLLKTGWNIIIPNCESENDPVLYIKIVNPDYL